MCALPISSLDSYRDHVSSVGGGGVRGGEGEGAAGVGGGGLHVEVEVEGKCWNVALWRRVLMGFGRARLVRDMVVRKET